MRTLELVNPIRSMEISKLILGTSDFGTAISKEQGFSCMDYYFENGGTTIDTANIYGRWGEEHQAVSEIIIGNWMKERNNRENVRIITKGLHPYMLSLDFPRVSEKAIVEDVEDSLNNLKTDYIDIYLLHRDDKNVEVGELMEQLHKYVTQGSIKIIGASNWTVERILEANKYARDKNLTPFSVSSIEWSLAQTTKEFDVFSDLPHMDSTEIKKYMDIQIPVLAWSAIANGIITKVIENGEASLKENVRNKFYNKVTRNRIENVRIIMEKTKLNSTQLSLGYITNHMLSGAAIIGCSSLEQLKKSMEAADVVIDKKDVMFLES